MVRPKFSKNLRNKIWNKNKGKCYHCQTKLFENKWDVDHYPVVYRDIEDQCYCFPCGTVTDPLDERNLQPACIACNRSGQYEHKKFYYCGHSQLRINKKYIKNFLTHFICIIIGIVVGQFFRFINN